VGGTWQGWRGTGAVTGYTFIISNHGIGDAFFFCLIVPYFFLIINPYLWPHTQIYRGFSMNGPCSPLEGSAFTLLFSSNLTIAKP